MYTAFANDTEASNKHLVANSATMLMTRKLIIKLLMLIIRLTIMLHMLMIMLRIIM